MTAPFVPGPDGMIDFAGLKWPPQLIPRFIAMVRGTYSFGVDGLDDAAAVRAWLRWMVSSNLANYEAGLAAAKVEDEVRQIREKYEAAAQAARAKAEKDVKAIRDGSATPPPASTV